MNLRFWPRRQEELDQEIESHLRRAARERVERGENPRQTEQSARREFGNTSVVTGATRDQWGWRWLEQLLQDLRYGVRGLRRSPSFAAVAILAHIFRRYRVPAYRGSICLLHPRAPRYACRSHGGFAV